jgi:hypothetical protein
MGYRKRTKNSLESLGYTFYFTSVPTLWATIIALCLHAWNFVFIWWAAYLSIMVIALIIFNTSNKKKTRISKKTNTTNIELNTKSMGYMPEIKYDDWHDKQWHIDYVKAYKSLL